MKLKIGDLVQFVECNRKRCKRPEAFKTLSIPENIHSYTAKVIGFGKKFKWFTDKKVVQVVFENSTNPKLKNSQTYWVPSFLLRPYEKLANHPITRIFI